MSFKCAELRRLAGVVLLAASVSFSGVAIAETQPTSASANKSAHHKAHHRKSHKPRVRGQKAIDTGRVQEIQEALIREHYLKGEPSGKWDASTQHAMQQYQADQGWQSKTVPDSRALIRLGLGPDNQHLLNPESAMTTAPVKPSSASTNTVSSAAPASASGAASMPAAPVSVPASGIVSDPAR
ncbi:MAG TPA: peptidoglycan-binding domain-containing protein [Terriglobales bacterium]|nr:peptidoglycan-binding domain-containing protein [Terriglobales bacterium]